MEKINRTKLKKAVIITLCIFALQLIAILLLALWMTFQPISLYLPHVVQPIRENEIKGIIKTIDAESYSKEYFCKDSNRLLSINDFYFLPSDTNATNINYFTFYQTKERYDGRSNIVVHEIYVDFYFESGDLYSIEKKSVLEKRYNLKREPEYTSNLFLLQSLVFVYNDDSRFTYVLFNDEEQRIICISLKAINYYSNVVFSETFAPKRRLWDSDFPKSCITGCSFNCLN